MKTIKDVLLHEVPVIVIALAAMVGLDTSEQNIVTQVLTDVITGVFALIPIFRHRIKTKKSA